MAYILFVQVYNDDLFLYRTEFDLDVKITVFIGETMKTVRTKNILVPFMNKIVFFYDRWSCNSGASIILFCLQMQSDSMNVCLPSNNKPWLQHVPALAVWFSQSTDTHPKRVCLTSYTIWIHKSDES